MSSNSKIKNLTVSAIIAGLYVLLTLLSAVFGFSYFGIQFRLSEILTVMPVFTPYAIPGLTVGCILGNIASPLGIIDVVIGSSATLFASIVSRLLRQFTFFKIPFFSLLSPVVFNSIFVSVELNLLTGESTISTFFVSLLTVGLGELVVCLGLGIPFYLFVNKNKSKIL